MAGHPSRREHGYEVSDASVRGLVTAVVAIAVGTLAAMGVVRLMMLGPENAPAAFGIATREGSFTHGPEEQTRIQQSWDELERELAESTGGYGWVDRDAGIVRVPLERAMELVVAEEGGGE
jgi:hypothetical protein